MVLEALVSAVLSWIYQWEICFRSPEVILAAAAVEAAGAHVECAEDLEAEAASTTALPQCGWTTAVRRDLIILLKLREMKCELV